MAIATASLGRFRSLYSAAWTRGMRDKLGLAASVPDETVASLANDLLDLMRTDHVDHTCCFRRLGTAARGDAEPARSLFLDLAGIDAWVERWRALEPGRRDDGPDQPGPRPPQPPGRGGPRRRDRRRPRRRSSGWSRSSSAPYDERPGLERYTEPAPESFGAYRTFCGT